MDKITKINTLIAPAMKTAVARGLIPGGLVDEETYSRHWSAMEAVVDEARAPLEKEIEARKAVETAMVDEIRLLSTQLAAARADAAALNDSCQAWIEGEAKWRQCAGDAGACCGALHIALELAIALCNTPEHRQDDIWHANYDLAASALTLTHPGTPLLAQLDAARDAIRDVLDQPQACAVLDHGTLTALRLALSTPPSVAAGDGRP